MAEPKNKKERNRRLWFASIVVLLIIEVRATATAGAGIVFGGFNGFYEAIKW